MSAPPDTTGSAERRLDALAGERLAELPAELAERIWDPDRCPVEWLPRLAQTFQVPIYSADWDVDEQRRVIAESIEARRLGGTVAGLTAVLDAAAAVYDYRETDEPYTAEIDLLNAGQTSLPTPQIVAILKRQKRAAVKLTVNQVVGLQLDLPVRSGLHAVTVAPPLEGALDA